MQISLGGVQKRGRGKGGGVGGNAVAQAEFFNILQCQEIFYEVHFCPDEKYFFPGPRAIQNITFFIITQFHDFFASLLYTK